MILIKETIKKFSYSPNKLSKNSHKLVVWKCDECDSIGIRVFRDCRDICSKCYTQKHLGRIITKNYCCKSCGGYINKTAALHGLGNCYSCYIKNIITRNYCCIECGDLITYHSAFYGSGRCLKCEHKSRINRYSGKNNPNYIDGRTPENRKIRNSKEYEEWRNKVFKRNNYTCQECNQIGYKLHAHHIKSFSKFPKLRFKLENGKTLCEECHSEIHPNLNSVKRKQ